MKFVDDVEEEKKIEENKKNFEKIELTDQVIGLQIPEIIWRNALDHFRTKGYELGIVTLRFLEILYKNGKVINIKSLKQKMKEYLSEVGVKNKDPCEIKIGLINASLQKCNKNDILNKFNDKYNKLLESEVNNSSNLHLIITNMLKYLNEQFLNEFDEEEATTIKFIIFKNIVKYIRKDEFLTNPQSTNNNTILTFLIEHNQSYTKILLDHKIVLKDLLQTIILNQISNQEVDVYYLSLLHKFMKLNGSNNLQIINEIFLLFQSKNSKAHVIVRLSEFSLGIIFEVLTGLNRM